MISKAARQLKAAIVRDALDDTPILAKRQHWEDATRAQATPSQVNVSQLRVGGVPCLLCTPDSPLSATTIVYLHGGGLVEGSTETHRLWTCRLALQTGCKVLSVDYRLAPEHPYPAAVEDVIAVCSALATRTEFADGYCIGADSTGCVLGLLALINSTLNDKYKPVGSFFLSPSIDLTFSGESIQTNAAHDPLVSLDVLKYYATLYAGNNDLHDPTISPLFANLPPLPPMLLLVDDREILYDDTIRLASNVVKAGGIAERYITSGLWHAWPLWGEFPESTSALKRIALHVASYG